MTSFFLWIAGGFGAIVAGGAFAFWRHLKNTQAAEVEQASKAALSDQEVKNLREVIDAVNTAKAIHLRRRTDPDFASRVRKKYQRD